MHHFQPGFTALFMEAGFMGKMSNSTLTHLPQRVALWQSVLQLYTIHFHGMADAA